MKALMEWMTAVAVADPPARQQNLLRVFAELLRHASQNGPSQTAMVLQEGALPLLKAIKSGDDTVNIWLRDGVISPELAQSLHVGLESRSSTNYWQLPASYMVEALRTRDSVSHYSPIDIKSLHRPSPLPNGLQEILGCVLNSDSKWAFNELDTPPEPNSVSYEGWSTRFLETFEPHVRDSSEEPPMQFKGFNTA